MRSPSSRSLLVACVSMAASTLALLGVVVFDAGRGAERCDERRSTPARGGGVLVGGDFDDYMQALDDLHEAEVVGESEQVIERAQLDELAPPPRAPDQPSGVPALASAKPVMSL